MKLKISLLNMAVPPTTEVSGLPRHRDRENTAMGINSVNGQQKNRPHRMFDMDVKN